MSRSVWIDGYEGKYQVTDNGQVISFYFKKPRQLHQSMRGYYLNVSLSRGVEIKSAHVHRLVAKHFVPGYKPELCVNHKNGIKTDNRAENLEWVTHLENLEHFYQSVPGRNFRKPVRATNIRTGEQYEFKGVIEGARFAKTPKTNVSAACRGKAKSAAGYRWEFI